MPWDLSKVSIKKALSSEPPTLTIGVSVGCLEAPTVIASSADPGSPTVASSGPSFPLATTAMTPALTALLTATESADASLFPSEPKERLMTSIPSTTAFSIPAITPSFDPPP
ncbi:hypothetical protein D1872_281280 [compost metagenome]